MPQWERFLQRLNLSHDEQLHLLERGFRAKIDLGETEATQDALAEIVSLRPPWRDPAMRRDIYSKRQVGRSTVSAGSSLECAHAKAISERIAILANSDPRVLACRAELGIPKKCLSPTHARRLLTSPLLAHAMPDDLQRWGIPLLDHESSVLKRYKKGELDVCEIETTWPGGKRTVSFGMHPDSPPFTIAFPSEKGVLLAAEMNFPSTLWILGRTADHLAQAAPFSALQYSKIGAGPSCVWLILTGVAKPLLPITIAREVPGSVDSVTINFLTRVASPASLSNVIADVQKQVLGHRKGRSFEARNLELVLFIERRTGGPIEKFPAGAAAKLWQEWNKSSGRKTTASHAGKRTSWGFNTEAELVRAYDRTKLAFFPDPRTPALEALLKGRLTYEMAALAAVKRELATRTGAEMTSEDLARELLDAATGDGTDS